MPNDRDREMNNYMIHRCQRDQDGSLNFINQWGDFYGPGLQNNFTCRGQFSLEILEATVREEGLTTRCPPHGATPLGPHRSQQSLPLPPTFHTGELTPSAGLPGDQSQGVSTSIILRPHEAVLSPFYCLENGGLERLGDLQVSGGVRYTPSSSRPKSSGLSTTAQLPLETRAGSEKQGLLSSRTPSSPVCRWCSIWGLSEQRWGYPAAWAQQSVQIQRNGIWVQRTHLKNRKSSSLLEVMGKWRLKCGWEGLQSSLLPSNLSFFLLFSVRPINTSSSIAM